MIKFPDSLVNNESVYLGDKRFIYKDDKLVPYVVTNVGTELPSTKLGIEILTTKRHPVSEKPLYVKTIDCGFLPASKTYKVIPVGITESYDYIKILSDDSYITIPETKDTGIYSFTALMPWYTLEGQIGTYIDAGNILIGVGSGHSNKKAYITVEYTKTADTSSSPIKSLYNGSLNEVKQNQETHAGWKRNGKDVYQIEIDFGFLPNATTKSVLVSNILPTYIAWIDNSKSYVYTGDANNEYYPVNIPSPINLTYQIGCWVSPKTQSLNIVTGINRSTQTARVVINYTK